MKTMIRHWLPAILLLTAFALVAGCTTALKAPCCSDKAECGKTDEVLSPAPVSDDELSYRNEPLIADSGVPAVSFNTVEPGDSDLVPRAFENAPPVIPHTVEGLLPITTAENQCADCHLPDVADDVGATSVPASHLYDIRRDRQLSELNPANYSCTLCHVSLADTGDLVANTFEPYFRARELLSSSDLLEKLNEGVR